MGENNAIDAAGGQAGEAVADALSESDIGVAADVRGELAAQRAVRASERSAPAGYLGRHAIVDLYGCAERALLGDRERLRVLLRGTAEDLGCTIVNELFHDFTPQGVSGVVLIAESHLSIHTWPELGYAAVDLYTCGERGLLDQLPGRLRRALGASRVDSQFLDRGQVDESPRHQPQPQLVLSPRGLSADRQWLTDAWASQILWTIQVREIVRDVHTGLQRLQVVDTERLGRILLLDGAIQCAEADEAGYHEMIVHPALCRRGAPSPERGRRVLIIGGGDGGAAREALRHRDVARVDVVEIDAAVIDAARALLPNIWRHPDADRALDSDDRLHIHIDDGLAWLRRVGAAGGPDHYDLIVVDSSGPIGPSAVLYTDGFYRAIRGALREGGAACVQGGSFWYLPEVFRTVYHGLKRVFPVVKPMECFTAVYPGGIWNLTMATLGDDPEDVDDARADRLAGLGWYSARRHGSAFAIPPTAWAVLRQGPPSSDDA
ncbi:MAG: hypothetical protein Tsb0020_07310 [Haliangiales bacterium]